MRVLYVGTFPPPEGGVRVGVQVLANELGARDDIELTEVDISTRANTLYRLGFYSLKIVTVALRAFRADIIIFSAPTNYTVVFGGIIYLISRVARRPFVIRNAAGHNVKEYQAKGRFTRFIMRHSALSAELNLYQTSEQVEFFEPICHGNVMLFSNHRKPPSKIRNQHPQLARKFVFLGRVEKEKGADLLIDVFSNIQADIQLDMYGEDRLGITDDAIEFDRAKVKYKGLISHNDIFDVLQNYDVLILPSHMEGQPGVVVESFLCGIPVIATSLPGVCDIVTDEVNGLLMPVDGREELKVAIERMSSDTALYGRLCEYVQANRERFTSGYWCNELVIRCRELSKRSAGGNKADSNRLSKT